jgi:hypothetical protein
LNDFTMNYMDAGYFAVPQALVVKAMSPVARTSSQRDIPTIRAPAARIGTKRLHSEAMR